MSIAGLDGIPNLDTGLDEHGLCLIMQQLGKYAPYIVREFYATYLATLHLGLPKNKRPIEQHRLQVVTIQGKRVDISEEMLG